MSLWVVDTSPLIFLAKLNHLDLLKRSADHVVAPPAVLREIAEYADAANESVADAERSWLGVRAVADGRILDVLTAELDAGEAEVIALALEAGAERVVLDDLDARRLAKRVGLVPIGTMGILLAASLRGEIPSLRAEIDRLRKDGFRVSPSLAQALVRAAGE